MTRQYPTGDPAPFEKSRGLPGMLPTLRIALVLFLLTVSPLTAIDLPPLPEGVASFGAAVAGDDLVVFGGHVGKTHQHSIENLSHRFLRLDLAEPESGWQTLDEVGGLQGLPLVAYGREVCRIGGLQARNHVGSDENLHSVGDVRCYDLDRRVWRVLPSLPEPRSSHDAVVYDDHLFVIGGWRLRGADEAARWLDTMEVLDLRDADATWRSVPQPFERRALAVAAAAGKVYAFGGLGKEGTSRAVSVYDVATERWSAGPDIPPMASRMKGFGVSAFAVGTRVYLSGGDGVVHALDAESDRWETNLAKLEFPRFFHRLLPHRERLLFLGGASSQGHLTDVETLTIASLRPDAYRAETAEPTDDRALTATWPGFRGRGDSRALDADLPLRWSAVENVGWKASIPGFGQSAPVLWHGQVFVTSVEGPEKETLIVSALSMATGEVRWRRRFPASQKVASSEMVSRGAPTPVVDEDRLYALWESGDLIALSHDGETLWQRSLTRDYGDFVGNHGVASSPVLTKEAVVVQVTHDGPSYFLAVEKATGQTHWKVDRPSGVAWTTPVVVAGKNGREIISSAAGRVEALDARTGERLWYRNGIEKNHVPSVAVDGGLVIVASADAGHNFAVRRRRDGELGDAEVAWTADGVTSGFGSPVVAAECVLFVNKAGAVHCVDRISGEVHWKHRLASGCWATPIVTANRVYFFAKNGETTVLEVSADRATVLAENTLGADETDTIYGVAAGHDAFLIRTGTGLFKITHGS